MYQDDLFWGQATSDGAMTDVELDGPTGTRERTVAGSSNQLAFFLVVGSLALLWLFGASIFKGSNQS
jgi:hypothetical protein